MRGMALFTGVGVALVTLFSEDGGLEAKATADHAAGLVDLGVAAVLVAGTTGEAATLTPDERDELVRAARAALPVGVPVIAGTGGPTGRQAAVLTERAFAAGADADLAVAGLKDSSGDAGRLLHEREVFAGDLWTGAASLITLSGVVGGAGALV